MSAISHRQDCISENINLIRLSMCYIYCKCLHKLEMKLPEKGLNAKNEAALEKKLAEYKAGLSEDEIRKLIADTKHLKEYQETPSPKEDLEKIPMLARSDMKKEAAPFYNTELSVKGIPHLQIF